MLGFNRQEVPLWDRGAKSRYKKAGKLSRGKLKPFIV